MDLKVVRVAVCLRERERESLFQEERPKAENDREPTNVSQTQTACSSFQPQLLYTPPFVVAGQIGVYI